MFAVGFKITSKKNHNILVCCWDNLLECLPVAMAQAVVSVGGRGGVVLFVFFCEFCLVGGGGVISAFLKFCLL